MDMGAYDIMCRIHGRILFNPKCPASPSIVTFRRVIVTTKYVNGFSSLLNLRVNSNLYVRRNALWFEPFVFTEQRR